MGKIKIIDVLQKENIIEIKYKVSNDLKQFFNLDNNFKIEYGESIEDIPKEIAVIPFLSNILPIIWLTNSTLELEKIEDTYFKSIEDTRQAFQKVYPNAKFKGEIKPSNIIKSKLIKIKKEKSSIFMSGGIDSISTLVSVIEKKPLLITIWGTDVWDHNEEGWKSLKGLAEEYSNQLNLKNLYIKTNFRKFIYEHKLTEKLLDGVIDDSWWRGIQHGIGLLGLIAPYVYKYNITTHYIPATLNINSNDNTRCGSCPEIDETVKYANCHIIHEGYDKTRNQKVEQIISFFREKNQTAKLRVCYMDKGDKLNCCKCEKCYRSMMEVLSEKVDLKEWGFDVTGDELKEIPKLLKKYEKENLLNESVKEMWQELVDKYKKEKKYWKKNKNVKWILKYNPYKKKNKILEIFKRQK